ncbi:hypothetical protein DFJ63DRAFT_310296 [Scheffersomyces coipomensis]|uniref:uncharacterized protein n=1 Tax=Scheffersomyces coipomensis TaxID=1788519 RepID=UPI00315D9D24
MSNKESSIEPISHAASSSYFEKQRDLLIQEISNNIDNVIYNLDILNRSLNESIQVGKEFDDVGRLWTNFYDGLSQLKERQRNQADESEPQEEADSEQPPNAEEDEEAEHEQEVGESASQEPGTIESD